LFGCTGIGKDWGKYNPAKQVRSTQSTAVHPQFFQTWFAYVANPSSPVPYIAVTNMWSVCGTRIQAWKLFHLWGMEGYSLLVQVDIIEIIVDPYLYDSWWWSIYVIFCLISILYLSVNFFMRLACTTVTHVCLFVLYKGDIL
jgi:hypothetical protein